MYCEKPGVGSLVFKRTGEVLWKSRIVHVNEVIGGKFGENFKAKTLEAPRRIGVMPGGLSDGVHPEQVKGCVLVRGKRVPVQSSICLEHTILDLTNFPEVQPGAQARRDHR